MSKYNSRHVKEDGHTFDSKAEHKRYCELKLLLRSGLIAKLEVHPSYPIMIGEVKICNVIFDFRYVHASNQIIIEDVKGRDLPMSRIKRKLFKAKYPDSDLRILTAR